MWGIENNKEKAKNLIYELKHQIKRQQRKKEYYLSKAIEAAKRGDIASSKIFEKKAVTHEKTRILTLQNLHQIEQIKEQEQLAEDMKQTAKVVKKARNKMNKEKAKRIMLKAGTILANENEEEQIIDEVVDLALQEGDMNPNEAERSIHREIETKIREELEPATEIERIRQEIQRQTEEPDY